MREDLPQGRVALLLTDIEGSTRLLHSLGAEGYALAQREHRDVLRAAFRAHNGCEVDTQGDAFFYAFPSTEDCMRGAVAGTRALAAYLWSHGKPIKVRMGMHTGVPQPTEEGYVGMVVNTAARVSAIGHGGQILLSEESAGDLRSVLEGDAISLRDLGQHRLKDLTDPQRLYQLVVPELPADFPPPRSAESKPNNLPIPLTPFIGRAREVVQVRDLLLMTGTRAVTLLGPGGTGKSRLALRVANELLHALDDGAFFIGLAAIRDPTLVLPAIASALGVKEEASRPLLDTLNEYFGPKQLLLVIDNFEQVQGAARDVAGLLAACPGLKVLATSRQPLRISGERGFPVPPLGLPEAGASLQDLAAVAQFEALRLFVERAQGVRWDFELSADNVADVVAICRKVDALPLAIELATARLYEMSTKQLLDALEQRLNVLTDGAVDLLDHQQTLRDLVAWSYDLLEPVEQRLWTRLAVFEGGGTLAAVAQICDAQSEYRFPTDLDSLVSKSLLNIEFDGVGKAADEAGESAGQRISMLETLREYGAEQLAASAEVAELRERHAAWYQDMAETAAPKLRSPEVETWLQRLDLDQANFRAVLHQGLHLGLRAEGSAEAAARTTGALWFYWYQRGLFTEGREWLERSVAAEVSQGATARNLLGLANLERIQDKAVQAKAHCLSALELFRIENDNAGVADSLSQLGAICQYLDKAEEAEHYLAEGVGLLREMGSKGRLSFTLVLLGALKQMRGDLAGAVADYEESLALGRVLEDKNYIATGLVNLGEVLQLQGESERAAEHFRESLKLYHELGVRNAIAYCFEMLAGIDADGERFAEAATLLGAADMLRELLKAPVESFNQIRYQRDLQRIRDALGEDLFRTGWDAGRNMQLEDAIEAAQHDGAD